MHNAGEKQEILTKEQFISIEVIGEVERPGVYLVSQGTCLMDVVKRAGLVATTDKRALYAKKTLISSCTIEVPAKKDLKNEKKKLLAQ